MIEADAIESEDDDSIRASALQARSRSTARQAAMGRRDRALMAAKDRLNLYFDPATSRALDELATRKKLSKSAIVEAAVASFLSPDCRSSRSGADPAPRPAHAAGGAARARPDHHARNVRSVRPRMAHGDSSAGGQRSGRGRERYQSFVETLG